MERHYLHTSVEQNYPVEFNPNGILISDWVNVRLNRSSLLCKNHVNIYINAFGRDQMLA